MNDDEDIDAVTGVERLGMVEAVVDEEGVKGNANGLKFGGTG